MFDTDLTTMNFLLFYFVISEVDCINWSLLLCSYELGISGCWISILVTFLFFLTLCFSTVYSMILMQG